MVYLNLFINPFTSQKFNYYSIKFGDFWSKQDFQLKLIWVLTLLFILLFFIFFLSLIFKRIKKNIKSKKEKRYRNELSDIFPNYLFNDDIELTTSNVYSQFENKKLNKKFYRAILQEEILNLHHNYLGEFSEKLNHLFKTLGFEKEVLNYITSKKWNIKANGIKIANQMQINTYAKQIFPLINDENSIVRIEAIAYYINFSNENPFQFLSIIKKPLSDYDQIKIHSFLNKQKLLKPPPLKEYLYAKNESVVIFTCKMIAHYKQEEAFPELHKIYSNASGKVKLEIIKTYSELNSKLVKEELISLLKEEKKNNIILVQLLKSLTNFDIEETEIVNILEFVLIYDFDVRFEATKVIKNSPSGNEILNEICKKTEPEISSLIQYSLS